ncbi:transient receptor potential cation channel subfamily M member 2-like isoform X2 [Lissotriton helveticus]
MSCSTKILVDEADGPPELTPKLQESGQTAITFTISKWEPPQHSKIAAAEAETKKWFKENIKKKECKHYVRSSKLSDHREEVCCCGNVKSRHPSLQSPSTARTSEDREWNLETDMEVTQTDSFGDLMFKGLRNKKVKYVRASDDTPPEVLYEMMTDHWHARKPNLLITVTGGAKNFSMNPRLKSLFSKGLVKAAQSTGAWIITGGCHAGVSKLVGEAVRDFSMRGSSYGDIVTIGIAPWGTVHNRDMLIRKEWQPAEYRLEVYNQGRLCCLDNNHSHFILVDNGTQGMYGVEIPLRTKLEQFICKQTMKKEGRKGVQVSGAEVVQQNRSERETQLDTEHGAVSSRVGSTEADIKIPIVCVVLEGDPGNLDTIQSSMINNIPCIVVEGSGRVADLIAEVADMDPSKITIALIRKKLCRLFQDAFSEKAIIECTKKIQDIVRMSELLTVFREDQNGAEDVDVVILQAPQKASQRMDHMENENWTYHLELAVLWNRLDLAKNHIFNSGWSWKPEDLYPALTLALVENRPNFVQLFLDQGVSLQDYLTEETLTHLYDTLEPKNLFRRKLEKIKKVNNETLEGVKQEGVKKEGVKKEGVNLHHVGKALKSLLGKFIKPLYSTTEPRAAVETTPQIETPLKYPIRDLLLWAVVQNRRELAEILWAQCQDCIVGALACSKILRRLSKKETDTDNAERMKALADLFEERASGVFSECFRNDEWKAELLLTRKSSAWGNTTCLFLAQEAEIRSFMSNGGVQMFLTKIWFGELSVDSALIPILICIALFPLVCTSFLKFRGDKKNTEDGTSKVKQAAAEQKRSKSEYIESVKDGSSKVNQVSEVERTDSPPDERGAKRCLLSPCQRLYGFFHAPVVVFYFNVVSYIIFLWLFSYVLMIDFQPTPSWREYLLYVWIFSLICDEVRQLFFDYQGMDFEIKGKMYIKEVWNQMDVVAIMFFTAGIIARFFKQICSYCHIPDRIRRVFFYCSICFTHSPYVGRVMLALEFIVFCLRLMFIFTLSKVLGPKIIMLRRMIKDIFFFLFLLAVWIVSFGVAKQAIIVHNEQRLDWIFRNVIYQPYLVLFQQIPTDVDKILYDSKSCTLNGTDPDKPQCAEMRDGAPLFPSWLTIVLLCLYLLFTSILLFNLLVAMFSHTFTEVQENTDKIWKFQRYKLIRDCYNRPPTPPPFILFNHLYLFIKIVILKKEVSSTFVIELYDYETADVLSWEEAMKENYLFKQREVQNQSSDNKVGAEVKLLKIEQDKHARALEQRQMLLEEKVSQSLSWIMKSLTENGFASKEKAPSMEHLKPFEVEEPTSGDKSTYFKCKYHVHSRQLMYPGTNVKRFPVPDELVPWKRKFDLYCPPFAKAERESPGTHIRNPEGRTGVKGLGSLVRYGPNQSLHMVFTRWKRDQGGSFVWKDSKKVLEVLTVKPEGSDCWEFPGGILEPGETLPSNHKKTPKMEFWKRFEDLKEGQEVYRGYLDDPRNTDDAWVETRAVNVNFEISLSRDILELHLHTLESTDSFRWQIVDEKIPLYANMNYILQEVARRLDAHY